MCPDSSIGLRLHLDTQEDTINPPAFGEQHRTLNHSNYYHLCQFAHDKRNLAKLNKSSNYGESTLTPTSARGWLQCMRLLFEPFRRPQQHPCWQALWNYVHFFFFFFFLLCGQSPSQWLCWCQCCSHSGYRHPVAAVDFLAACPPPLLASSLITLAYWSSQGHGTLELRLGLHQLMTDYSTTDPREQAGGAGTEGVGE